MDDSLQPTIDMLLNLAIFMWFGAVCPWSSFLNNNIISIYRLIFLGILILFFRRLPIILAMHKHIHQIEHVAQAAFVGFFGPIGVGAIFYLSISREYLLQIRVDGQVRGDAFQVAEAVNIVVWFLVIFSIVSVLKAHVPFLLLSNPFYLGCAWSLSPSRKSRLPYSTNALYMISTSSMDKPDQISIPNVTHAIGRWFCYGIWQLTIVRRSETWMGSLDLTSALYPDKFQ